MARLIAVLAATVLALTATGSVSAADFDGVRGNTVQIKGSIAVTFWADFPQSYKVFRDGAEKVLIESPKISAPAGWTVKPESVRVTKQKGTHTNHMGRQTTTYTYDEYLIEGVWTVTIPAAATEGSHGITIGFPEIDQTNVAIRLENKKQFGTERLAPSSMSMNVIVHASSEAMAQAVKQRKADAERAKAERDRWPWYAYLLLLIPAVPAVMLVLALGAGVVSLFRSDSAKTARPAVGARWTADDRDRT